jgi:hypothetical protein
MMRFDLVLAAVAALVVGNALASGDPIAELPDSDALEPLELSDDREPLHNLRGALRDVAPIMRGEPRQGDWVLVRYPDKVRVLPKPQCWAEMRRINLINPGYALCIQAGTEP